MVLQYLADFDGMTGDVAFIYFVFLGCYTQGGRGIGCQNTSNEICYSSGQHKSLLGWVLGEYLNDLPVVFLSMSAQLWARVGGNRIADDLHQRQVINRITIKPNAFEIISLMA